MTRFFLPLLLVACGEKDPPVDSEASDDTGPVEVTNEAPQLAEVPEQAAWTDEAWQLDLAAYASDDSAPAVSLTYTVTRGDGAFEGSVYTHTFTEPGAAEVGFSVSDPEGLSAEGSFTVVAAEPLAAVGDPTPEDGGWDVELTTGLSWSGGGGAEGFEVYLSTDPYAVANGAPGGAAHVGTVTSPGWSPPAELEGDTTWYWRVDATLGEDTLRGPVWTFDTQPANLAPLFDGLLGVAAAGGEAAQLVWSAGLDPEDEPLTYAVYIGTSADDVDWSAPAFTSEEGATGLVLTAAELSDLQPGAELWFGVRAVDPHGLDDGNQVAAPLTLPSASAARVFVDDDASGGGSGTLADPYDDLQDAIDAVEAAGGGVVLVAEGSYPGPFTLSDDSGEGLLIFGGLPDLATLDPSATEAELLEARDAWLQPSLIEGSGDLITVDNDRRLVHLGGLHLDGGASQIDATDAQLRVTECSFTDSAEVGGVESVRARDGGDGLDVQVYGSRFTGVDNALDIAGPVSRVVLANSDLQELSGFAILPEGPSSASADLLVPAGASAELRVEHNHLFRLDALLEGHSYGPVDEDQGGDLRLVIRDNTLRYAFSQNAIELNDVGLVGDGGSFTLEMHGNSFFGISGDCLYARVSDDALVQGAVTLRLEDNDCVHSTGDGFELRDIAAAAGETTSIEMRGNRFSQVNGAVKLYWVSATDDNDEGVISAEVSGNGFFNVGESLYVSLGGGEGLESWLLVHDNRLGDADQDSLDLRNGAAFDSNGDAQPQAEANLWIAHNHLAGSADGEATRVAVNSSSLLALRNNAIGFNDTGASEALELSSSSWGGGQVDIRNNVFAWSAGDGVYVSSGVNPQLVNNTIAYAGRATRATYAIDSYDTDDHSQTFVHGCVLYEAAGEDLDAETWASFSLTGDGSGQGGYGSVVGDPRFAGELGELDEESLLDFDTYFRPLPGSPLLDAGDPNPDLNDPDGSRNDIGAFGGPGAAWVGLSGEDSLLEVIGMRPWVQLHQNTWLMSGSTPIRLLFTEEVDPSSVDASSVSITDSSGAVAGSFSVDGRTVTFTPSSSWPAAEDIRVEVTTRVLSVGGVANRFPWIEVFGTAPSSDTAENEGNNDVASADPISGRHFHLSGTINSSGGDPADVFSITATAGQRLSVSTFSERIGAEGAVRVQLLNSAGDEVKWSTTMFGDYEVWENRDGYLDHVFEADGTYYLVLDEDEAHARVQWEMQGWIR